MKRSTQLKLAEVEAGYRRTKPAAHRCGLYTCQEDGECAFPTRCVALADDLSDDGLLPPPRDHIASLAEVVWLNEGAQNGWQAPPRRSWWRRLPVIRHVAGLLLSWKVHTYAGEWARAGVGIGGPAPYDLWVVEGYLQGYV